jgi:hypothetical protein
MRNLSKRVAARTSLCGSFATLGLGVNMTGAQRSRLRLQQARKLALQSAKPQRKRKARQVSQREGESLIQAPWPEPLLATLRLQSYAMYLERVRVVSDQVNADFQHHAPSVLRYHFDFIDSPESLPEISSQLLPQIVGGLQRNDLGDIHAPEFILRISA